MYSGSDIAQVPKKPGVYSLVRSVKNQNSTEWVYTGMSGNLRDRVGQHLTQQSGTYSGNKNAASINLERLTHVRWWDCSHIPWPSDIEQIEPGNEKVWKQAIAGSTSTRTVGGKKWPPARTAWRSEGPSVVRAHFFFATWGTFGFLDNCLGVASF